MTWGTCGGCYWFRKRQAALCADQEDAEHECKIGMFRPAKIRRRPKGGSCTSAGDPAVEEGEHERPARQ